MAELTEEYKEKTKPGSGSNFLFIFVSIVVVNILHKFFKLPYTLALALAVGIGLLIDYWVPPKPPVSLPAWVLRISGLTVMLVASLWLIPGILSHLIWKPVAYALPAFFLLLSRFCLPSIYVENFWTLNLLESNEPETAHTRRKNLIRWALISFVMAALFGVAIYYLDKT